MGTIGILLKSYPKLSETFILEEILGLERTGMRLHVVSLNPPKDDLTHAHNAQVRAGVSYLPRHGGRRLWALARLCITHPYRLVRALWRVANSDDYRWHDLGTAAVLGQAMRALDIYHLHSHFISQPSSIAHLAHILTRVPFSISAHAKDIYLSTPAGLRDKLRAARFTVTCTEYNHAHLLALAQPPARVHRVYHGIDLEVFRRRSAERPGTIPLILAVGRLKSKKGFAHLINACAILRRRAVPFQCEIVGYGSEETRLRAQIAESELGNHVHLLGGMNREGIIERYHAASVFALPCVIASDGDRDGIPNAILEAMAMELPVVTTPVSGIPEVVKHDSNGILVAPADARALADALATLLTDAARRQRLGQAARITVATMFNNDRNLLKLRALLETNAASPQSAPVAHADIRHAE